MWETLICIAPLVKAATEISKLNFGGGVFFLDWQSQQILLALEKTANQSNGSPGNSICCADVKKKIEWAKNTKANCKAKSSVKLLSCHKHCKTLS